MGAPAYSRGFRATILVVDDEPRLRALMVRSLKEVGFRVLSAADGIEALAILDEAGPIDLLVTDIGMPGVDGRMLAAQFVAYEAHAPTLFISARVPEGPPLPGAFLAKPFSPAALAATAAEMLAAARR